MDIDSIEKAMSKNPKKWAAMYLESQEMLDSLATEMTLYNDTEANKPLGVFDNTRAKTMLKLLNYLQHQMFGALCIEREKDNVQVIGKPPSTNMLKELHESLECAYKCAGEYLRIREIDPNFEVSKSLKEHNPCNVQMVDRSTGRTLMAFETVEQGLANTMSVVKYVLNMTGPACTYVEFFNKWFEGYVHKEELVRKATKMVSLIRTPTSAVLKTDSNYIVLTEILTQLEYEKQVDLEYIKKHYTLDKYVAAVSLESPDVRSV